MNNPQKYKHELIGGRFENFKHYAFEDPNHAIIILDRTGRIVYFNNTFLRHQGLKREDVEGRFIEDVYVDGRMRVVLKSGLPEKGYVFTVNGRYFIASSYPIYKDDILIGVIGRSIFLDTEDAFDFAQMMTKFEDEVKFAKEKVLKNDKKFFEFENPAGNNTYFLQMRSLARAIANTNSTVLITGESGTGKDLFAKGIHYFSKRKMNNFVRINCAAIPEQLLESELFGYCEGTFTGARKGGKKGKFELADQGTIFLDEIGEMSMSMQSKLLVVLQEKEIEPLGSELEQPKKIDVRVIAATNQDLIKKIAEGSFREDLYFRLNVLNLHLPPLRERKDDIELLARRFLKKINKRLETVVNDIEPEAMRILYNYNWPGNVRELENFTEKAIIMASIEGKTSIQAEHIFELVNKPNLIPDTSLESETPIITSGCQLPTMKNYIHLCEKRLIEEVLRNVNGDKQAAARILDIHVSALYKKINKYGLDKLSFVKGSSGQSVPAVDFQ